MTGKDYLLEMAGRSLQAQEQTLDAIAQQFARVLDPEECQLPLPQQAALVTEHAVTP